MMRFVPYIVALSLAACGPDATGSVVEEPPSLIELGPDFVASAEVRREALEQSLVDSSNGYSQLRLQNYATAGGWDDLPVRNFAVRAVRDDEIGTFDDRYYRTDGEYRPVFDSETFEWTHEALLELGRDAFHNYPIEVSGRFATALADDESVEEFGLWRHDGRVGGLVRAQIPNGGETFGATCSTCHASTLDGALVDGRANANIDHSALLRRARGLPGSDWGPGVVDVTPDGVDNPVAISDLRPIRHQQRLHWAATLHNSPAALAVRVDTLLITSANKAMRPPREVSVALAYYLWSLGEAERKAPTNTRGAALFERECATCHGAADSVPLAMVGTDPAAGESSMRGTGDYRVPSLYRVGTRSQYLHQGKVGSLEELFDPARPTRVRGHLYGTNLSAADRAALIEYLQEL